MFTKNKNRRIARFIFVFILVTGVFGVIPVQASYEYNGAPALDPSKLSFQEVAPGLSNPLFIGHAGDGSGRLFIVERSGRIRIIKNGTLLATPFLDIESIVKSTSGEQGLLGLAFHPSYKSNGKFYVVYTAPRNGDSNGSVLTLRQYTVSTGNPDLANANSGTNILTIDHPTNTNHNGGTIVFGNDGYLYWSTGDGGGGGDPSNNAQNLTSRLGKILRIDVNSGSPYAIPASNPFYSDPTPGIKKEIWAYGLRNPWRMSFDRSTNDLYIGDVGQSIREEIDFQSATSTGGENYGWRVMEGSLCYNPSSGCDQTGKILPVAEYDHSLGCSVTGGHVYRGSSFPSLTGYYLYGDFCSGRLFSTYNNLPTGWSTPLQLADTAYSISTFGEDENGELYLADYSSGKIYKIQYADPIISGNAGIAGVTLSYTDGTPKTVTSQGDGSYTFVVPSGWSGTVTPSRPCYTFTPSNRVYGNITTNQTAQNYTATFNPASGCAEIDVTIGGDPQGNYTVPKGVERREYYAVSGGPVVVESTNGVKIVSAIRLQSFANDTLYSFVETMGVPQGLLSYKYYFPTYDNTWPYLNSQLRFGNLNDTAINVKVTIGTDSWTYPVPAHTERREYLNVSGGPVVIESLDPTKKIVAAIRLQSMTASGTLYSFAETMGIPDEQLSDTYYFPTYNNTWGPLNSQLRFANLNDIDIKVKVTIGTGSWIYPVPAHTERREYQVVSGGPVIIQSLDAVTELPDPSKKIVAAIRLQSFANNTLYSFVETMGVPQGLLSHKYYFPTYNNTWPYLNSQLRFGNLNDTAIDVKVTIGTDSWVYSVAAHTERREYLNVSGGPVVIESLDPSKKIVAAIRLQSMTPSGTLYSFAETMGIPDEQLSDTYYFPTYNNTWAPLNSQLRFGVP